jgi:hypothetical protein
MAAEFDGYRDPITPLDCDLRLYTISANIGSKAWAMSQLTHPAR